MDGNTELLNYVYQNAQMGESATDQLIGIAQDDKFLEHLRLQREEYHGIQSEAEQLLKASGHEVKELSMMQEVPAQLSIGLKTLTDKSVGHMAEMMLQGSTMGIVDATKNIHRYEGEADKESLSLAKKLLRTEESNVEHLKAFLS